MVKTVKKDLRQLRELTHAINAEVDKYNRLARYIETVAERDGEGERTDTMRAKLKQKSDYIDSLRLEVYKLKGKYSDAIGKLEDVEDNAIATEAFLVGRTYKSIAVELFFSEAGVKKRIERIYKKIAKIMN